LFWWKRVLTLVIFFLLFTRPVKAAQTYDQTNGTYTDNFANNIGVPTRSQMNVNTGTGVLQLTKNDGSGNFSAPFYTSGYVYTSTIIPTSVAKWGTITFSASVPPNTTLKFQIYDGDTYIFSDTFLNGNESGFSSSPIDISSLPVYMIASNDSNARICQLKIKILMTSDTNVTPTIDSFTLSWTVKQGDLTASLLEDSAKPVDGYDQKNTFRSAYANESTYPAFRWANEKIPNVWFPFSMLIYDGKLISNTKAQWSGTIYDRLYSLNRDTGAINYSIPYTFDSMATITRNGTFYSVDSGHDVLTALDLNDGSGKWSYSWGGGHGNISTSIASDGTLYTVRMPGTNDYFTVYAFKPDGTVKWTKTIDPTNNALWVTPISLGSDGTIYFGTAVYSGGDTQLNQGKLYALNPTDGSIKWEYATGDLYFLNDSGVIPAIDDNGVIYVGNYANGTGNDKFLYAINSDGTLKWSKNYGTNNHLYKASLRNDDVFLINLYSWSDYSNTIEAINTNNGSVLWSKNFPYVLEINVYSAKLKDGYLSADSHNGFYLINHLVIDEANVTENIFYYDSGYNLKWKISSPVYPTPNFDIWYSYWFSIAQDERGWVYGTFSKSQYDAGWNYDLPNQFIQYFALAPWTLTVSNNANQYVHPGDTITFTATTAMQQTNALFSSGNQAQVVIDNGDKVTLSYSSTNSSGDTIWTGSYTVPSGTTDGSHTYTVEAAQSYLQTDTTTHFASAPASSNNTGLTISGAFTIDTTAPSSSWTANDGGGRTFSSPQTNVFATTLHLPSFTFTKAKDTTAGIQKYQILIKPEGKDYYTYIDDISADCVSGTIKDETDRYTRCDGDNIFVSSKRTQDQLANGGYKWKVRVLDKAGNQTDTEEKILLINTHQANFSKTWFPLVLLSTKPSFYGITTVGSKVTLELKQNNQTILTKQTTANAESRFGINLTKADNLKAGEYQAFLSATNQHSDYIELPEFTFTYGKKTLPAMAGARTSQAVATPIPIAIELTPEPTPTLTPVPPKPKRCFLFWCW